MQAARVKIKMLGSFSVLVDGNLALEQLHQAKKTALFLEYLILKRNTPVSHAELLSALWSERSSRNPATALRTLLHRYRALVEQCGIAELNNSVLTVHGGYRWNPDLPVEIDIYELERLCREAAGTTLSDEARIERYEAVLDLYDGPLLRDASGEPWIAAKSVYYHDLYIESVLAYLEILQRREQYERIIHVCRRAMDVDLFDERLHLAYSIALTKTGQKYEALSQYRFVSKLRQGAPDMPMSDSLREMSRNIALADSNAEADIARVLETLESDAPHEGAFVCSYDVFRMIYQMQRRMLLRHNDTMFLALICLDNAGGEPVDELSREQLMEMLLDTAQKNLRRGDTITRFSALQYAMLLPSVTYESGRAVLERIKQLFYDQCRQPAIRLTYKLRALDMHLSAGAPVQQPEP